MRPIDLIVLHHTASPLTWTIEDVRASHLERGWQDIGYHIVVTPEGEVLQGRPIEVPGAHVRGMNKHSIGVVGIGDNTHPWSRWTAAQEFALRTVLQTLKITFPGARVAGHNNLAETLCPGIDIAEFL